MTEIAHGETYNGASIQNHALDTDWTALVTFSASNFVGGGVYLLHVEAQVGGESASIMFGCRVVHGSTAFNTSEMLFEPPTAANGQFQQYSFFTVFTQPGTAEDIIFQYKTTDALLNVRASSIGIRFIRLDADLVSGTDYIYAEDDDTAGPTNHTTDASWSQFASITFTPDNADDV